MIYPHFATKLLDQRQSLKLTQEELASRIGVTPQAVSKWERGLSLPDVELFYQLGKILSLSMDELWNISNSTISEQTTDTEKEKINRTLLCDPITLKIGTNFLEYLIKENQLGFPALNHLRFEIAKEFGYLIPTVRILDDITLEPNYYQILFYDTLIYSNHLATQDPKQHAEIFHSLKELCISHYDLLLNRQMVKELIDNVAKHYPVLVEGYLPEKLSYAQVQQVLKAFIKKKKSIRNLATILEYVEDNLLYKEVDTIIEELLILQ